MSTANDLTLLLDFLPDLSGKKVLQLGSDEACTRVLADKQAELVYVIEGSEENLCKNRTANEQLKNVQFCVKHLIDINADAFQY